MIFKLNRSISRAGGFLLIGELISLCSCASQPVGDPALLNFLQPAKTSREQIITRFGVPASEYRQDRVLIYGLDRDKGGYMLGWPHNPIPVGRFHLVIELDERDILQRYLVLDISKSLPP